MKTKFYLFFVAIFIAGITFVSCDKDDTNTGGGGGGGNDNQPEAPIELKPGVRHYFTSASYGDIIQLTIDGDNSTYSFINETTGESGSGSLGVSSDPKLNGIFESKIGGKSYHLVELAGVAVISTLKLGNTQNRICFGVSSDIHADNNYTMADFAGKYVSIPFDDSEKDPMYMLVGTQVYANGMFTVGMANANFTAIEFSGIDEGTIAIDEEDNTRLNWYSSEEDFVGEGVIYPDKMCLIDYGEGDGFRIAVEYPQTATTQSQIAGSYKMVGITSWREEFVGYVKIPASGTNINLYHKYNDGTIYDTFENNDDMVFNSFKRVLNNVFELDITVGLDDEIPWTVQVYFILLPGEMVMFFEVEGDGTVGAYGLALKVN